MPSTQRDVAKSSVSPVLFMTTDGEPMCFFLRPGPVKRSLQPLITAGGGLLSNVQQPGAILLIDPEEGETVPEGTAHRYVSTKYVYDCIEKEEQLNLEHYRLNPEVGPRHSARLNNKEGSPGLSGGRVSYSPEDDAAILSYVSQRKAEIGGNRLWQEMEKQHVTSHSWQSMKYRYRTRLAKKHSELEEVKTAEEETKDEDIQETFQKPSCEDNSVPPPQLPVVEPSAENDLTQVMDQPVSAKSETEDVEAQTLNSSHGEVQHVDPRTFDAQTAEGPQVETIDVGAPAPQSEACLDPESDERPVCSESTEALPAVSPQNEDSPQPLPDTPSVKRKVKQKVSPKLQDPQRRVTRRQLELEVITSSEPYGKKLRSSSHFGETSSSALQSPKKTKSSVKSAHKGGTTVGQPLSKRARGESVTAAVESHQGESEVTSVPETQPQPDEESTSLPHKGAKKKEKRKWGILELATKEFEDESESGEDEAPDLQNPAGATAIQATSTEPCLSSSDTAADASPARSNSESGPSLQSKAHNGQAASSNPVPETGCPNPAATVPVASRAHLFIFENESQGDDSQSLVGEQAVVNENTAPSLTQAQLEEDMQQIKGLMTQTNQDLVSVTKALLKTSGDVSAALNLLSNPSSFSGPFWNSYDDNLLLSADPDARQQLQEKYGEESLAKRVVFLEVEG